MAKDLKFMILNADEQLTLELRTRLLSIEGVKIVAEVEEPALLAPAVSQFPVDVLFVNLDPSPEAVLPIVAEVIAAHRELTVFAASSSTDGPLILKVMRLGVREFLPKPIDPAALTEAIHKVSSHRLDNMSQGKLITVIGTGGGVGATTIATNLAVELAALAKGNVTAVDFDFRFGQVATLLDVDPTYTLADLCGSTEHLEQSVVSRALSRHATGVQVLCRPLNLAESENITAASCTGVLATLMAMNEYVVVDGPTRFDLTAKSVLSLSDVNLLIVQLVVPCVRTATRIIDHMRTNGYNLDRTKLICNRVGRESGHLSAAHVSETLGLEVFASIPDDWEAVSAAINLGEPLLSHEPRSKVRLSLQEIAQRMHAHSGGEDEKEPASAKKEKSLIGRIFAQTP